MNKHKEHDWNKVVGWGVVSPEYFIDKPGTAWQRFKTWCASRHEIVTNVMKWFSTVVMLLAAGCIAMEIRPMHIYLLNLGSLCWLITALLWRERSLIVVNGALLLVYIYGFIRTL
jgi:hypothetical protein